MKRDSCHISENRNMNESEQNFEAPYPINMEENDMAAETTSSSRDEDQEVNNALQPGILPIMEIKASQKTLDADHPLMIKYQQDLKERLLKLILEADEQLVDLQRTISAQEKQNEHFAKRGYDIQKELHQNEEKLKKIHDKYEEQIEVKQTLHEKCQKLKSHFETVESARQDAVKSDIEFRKNLEDIAFEVVQLTSLQMETFTDAKSLERAVEKSLKERENLELQKLRQDLLITRFENDKFNLEDKINLYKTQWGIKKEEANDLRKELNAANSEMQSINFEKQQIVHQWKQSLSSLEKQDQNLSAIRESVRVFEDDLRTLNVEIAVNKKSVRKELERNEQFTLLLQIRESDIARIQKDLSDTLTRENRLQEDLSVVEQIIEITEKELAYLTDSKILKEKDLETKEREIRKAFAHQKELEGKHMDILHEKITITKASKYTEKMIKDIRNSIRLNEDKGSKKESEKEQLLLKLDNLHTYLGNMETDINKLREEGKEREALMNKSEVNVLKAREKMDMKRNECKALETELHELINKAGGQELAPFERELANLRNEINISEQGKRNMEREYLRFQRELFSLTKQSAVRCEENDMYKKKIVIMEGKKMQLEADIVKEEKDIKEAQNRILSLENDLARINKLLGEKQEIHEDLQQSSELLRSDLIKVLKDAELNYLQKQNELRFLRRKKRKNFCKMIEAQESIVYWEGKVYLVEETRRILKSDTHLDELFQLKSDIRRLQVKQQQIKKDQESLVQDMSREVYRYTSLYVEADKQALFGKRRKTPEYISKRINTNLKKIYENKKNLEGCMKQIEALKTTESELNDALANANLLFSELMNKINCVECDTDDKQQEKRQAVLRLSFKQKKTKYLQKIMDNNYIRAVRNEDRRNSEIEKLRTGLHAVHIIVQATMNEHPDFVKDLNKIIDYIIVSKDF